MKRFFALSMIMMIAATTLVTSSCSKYPEGSNFTILTKKARLVNVWTLTKATSDGTDVTEWMPTMKMDIKKDDTYSITFTSGSFSSTETGTWAFTSDKTKVALTDSDGDVSTFEILMLKNKDLKIKDSDNTSSEDIFTFTGE